MPVQAVDQSLRAGAGMHAAGEGLFLSQRQPWARLQMYAASAIQKAAGLLPRKGGKTTAQQLTGYAIFEFARRRCNLQSIQRDARGFAARLPHLDGRLVQVAHIGRGLPRLLTKHHCLWTAAQNAKGRAGRCESRHTCSKRLAGLPQEGWHRSRAVSSTGQRAPENKHCAATAGYCCTCGRT